MSVRADASSGTDEEGAIVAEINITPLTDIFLVLLVIFMVTTTAMNQMGVDITLPKSGATTSQSQPEGVVVTLLPTGEMRINDLKIASGDYAGLEKGLRAVLSKASVKLVILEGDQKAFLGSVIDVMDRAKNAGADRFAIATQAK